MKVLKPMSDLLLHCLPVFEKYSFKLSTMFIVAEDLCGNFDKCVPSGAIHNRVCVLRINVILYFTKL